MTWVLGVLVSPIKIKKKKKRGKKKKKKKNGKNL